MRYRNIYSVIVASLLLIGISSTALAQLREGQKFPEYSVQKIKGKEVSISDFNGKLLVINVWADFSGPSVNHTKRLLKLYKNSRKAKFQNEKGMEVLNFYLGQDKKEWIKAVDEHGFKKFKNNVSDLQYLQSRLISEILKTRGIPHLVLLDGSGNVIKTGISIAKLEEEIASMKK